MLGEEEASRERKIKTASHEKKLKMRGTKIIQFHSGFFFFFFFFTKYVFLKENSVNH